MGFLEKVSSKDRNIYWCYKRGDPVNERIEKLLEAYHGFKVPIDDFDDTMQAFGKEFNFYFSEKTIRDIINKRAEKLIDKFKEMERNRLKALSKKEAEESLSSTESMTFDYLESARKKSIDALESSIAKNPKKADYYYDLGREYFLDEQYGKAVEYLTKAIKLKPCNAEYYHLRGISYHCLNEFKKAVADQTKAIELDPEKPMYYYSRGGSYNWLNEYDKAVADCTKAIGIDPDEAMHYSERGKNYNWLNEYDKAVADYTKAIEIDPDNALYYTDLARMLCKVGNVDSALDNLNKAFSLNKDLPECYNTRGYIKLKIAKRAGVACETDILNDFNKVIELKKDKALLPFFYTCRAEYYLYSGEIDNAYNDLQKALAIYSRYGGAYYFLAKYYEAKGNKQECENCMTKVKECRFIPDDDD
jgi:tetratricopeptide (TPR) repeat protein